MATFDASKERAVSIELKEKITTLYMNALSVYNGACEWTLNGTDPMLPMPFDVKIQLDAYQALAIDRLRLTDWITALQGAVLGDTLFYPPAPLTGLIIFDETIVFDENLIF